MPHTRERHRCVLFEARNGHQERLSSRNASGVGYYTTVAGLGLSPSDVVINGQVNVYNQCFGTNCIALDNFWRSLSNLTINGR